MRALSSNNATFSVGLFPRSASRAGLSPGFAFHQAISRVSAAGASADHRNMGAHRKDRP